MKIKIKPYPIFRTTLKIEEFLAEKLNIPEKYSEKLCVPIQFVFNIINSIDEYLKRKNTIKIHNYDTWSMNCTLSLIVLPMLLQLKKTKHGAPIVDDEDLPESLQYNSEELEKIKKQKDVQKYWDRWDYVIDRMIYSFDYLANDKETEKMEEFITIDNDALFEKFGERANKTLDIFDIQDKNGIDFIDQLNGPKYYSTDYEKLKEHEDYVDEGFKLFGKYYRNLWD